MSSKNRKSITEKQWLGAVESYELGTKHASQVALDLGVSLSTVSREFKRRGCAKACRVAESIAPLVAELDAKDRAKARRRNAEIDATTSRGAALNRMIDDMMKSIVAADRVGNLAAAGPAIEKARRSLAS